MSYKTYTTEALVCGSHDSYTSDRSFLLFTKDSGMLWATAKSVREEHSKQRYALQDFSHIRVTLLKGKSGWRIASVEALRNPFLAAQTRTERGRVAFVVTQLRRYVQGEAPLPKIYDDALFLLYAEPQATEQNDQLQQLFSVRLLAELGYIAANPSWEHLVAAQSLTEALEGFDENMAKSIGSAIKQASEVSHL